MWVTKISTEISIFAIVGYSFHFSFLWADLAASSQAGQCWVCGCGWSVQGGAAAAGPATAVLCDH